MLTVYKSGDTGLATIEQPTSGCWINAVAPTQDELAQLHATLSVPSDLIHYPLDPDERARTEKENGVMLIVLRLPHFQSAEADVPYTTVPLWILLTDQFVATVCHTENSVIQQMASGRVRGLSTAKRNRFLLRLLLIMAGQYLSSVRAINKNVETLEDKLQRSLRNRELQGLLRYQKSLTYFTTALKSDELILQHLYKSQMFHQYPDDLELLEDVLTEVQQAIEMSNISSNILSQMMDAFASIISNNLNVVMKFLASVTIILNLPTLVASVYGMNIDLPFQNSRWSFPLVMGVSLGLSLLVTLVFWRKDWL